MNSKKQVCCHHVRKANGKADAYLLMRKTPKPNESLEKAVKRGLKGEFGAQGKIIRYLGSIESSFVNWQKIPVQKTTLYFLCRLIGIPKAVKHVELDESEGNKTEWRSAKFLVSQMKKQRKTLRRSDFDESEILKRV